MIKSIHLEYNHNEENEYTALGFFAVGQFAVKKTELNLT